MERTMMKITPWEKQGLKALKTIKSINKHYPDYNVAYVKGYTVTLLGMCDDPFKGKIVKVQFPIPFLYGLEGLYKIDDLISVLSLKSFDLHLIEGSNDFIVTSDMATITVHELNDPLLFIAYDEVLNMFKSQVELMTFNTDSNLNSATCSGGGFDYVRKAVLPKDAAGHNLKNKTFNCVAIIDGQLVATDSHRVHAVELEEYLIKNDVKLGLILPEAQKIISLSIITGDHVFVKWDDKQTEIKTGELHVCHNTIENDYMDFDKHDYPTFERIFKGASYYKKKIEGFDSGKLAKSVKQIKTNKINEIVLSMNENYLNVNSKNDDNLNVKVSIDGTGEGIIGVNKNYFIDALSGFDSPSLYYEDCNNPMFLFEDGSTHRCILMPMQL